MNETLRIIKVFLKIGMVFSLVPFALLLFSTLIHHITKH